MKKIVGIAIVALGLNQIATADQAPDNTTGSPQVTKQADKGQIDYSEFERVNRINRLGNFHSWQNVDDRSVIVWTSPSKPYLIELSRPSRNLRFNQPIALTLTGNTVHERFDSLIVDGIRNPIKGIYKLDRETAKNFRNLS